MKSYVGATKDKETTQKHAGFLVPRSQIQKIANGIFEIYLNQKEIKTTESNH